MQQQDNANVNRSITGGRIMSDRPCVIEDLKAYVEVAEYYKVTEGGEPSEFYSGDLGEEPVVIYYYCERCDETFEPEDRDSSGSKREAWQAALAHLGKTEVTA
jgi:hypothetical protein